jgi:alginate O-acetyltransferase complex protein AlgJ
MLLYRQRIGKWSDRVLIALFVLAIALPLVGFFLGRSVRVRTELRKPAERPQLSLQGRVWKYLPHAFEAYFNDHFGFRAVLIGWSNVLKLRWLNVSTSPSVLIGLDNWLYYRPMPVAELPGSFTADELQTWQRVLEHRQQWLARRGCRYLLFIPPNKETIYPEHLPSFARPYASVPRLDQLVDHLRRLSSVPVLDVRSDLRQASQQERTYFRTDQHWNDRGAFVAYQHLIRELSHWFPTLQPWPRSAFRDTRYDLPSGDLAQMLGQDQGAEEWLNMEPLLPRKARICLDVKWPARLPFPPLGPFAFETDDDRLPRAVVFHDSFAIAPVPFLSEHFRHIAYCWHDDFLQEVVVSEHPDVVLQEILERKLNFLKPNDIEE